MGSGFLKSLLLAAALAAAPARVGAAWQLGSLNSAVNAKITADSALVWAGDRPLVRADFRAPVPDAPSEVAAVTASGMLHAIACDAAHLEYAVYALFMPGSSWTRPEALLDGPAGVHELAHEQGHFDLTEIAARQLRADLKRFNVACDSATSAFELVAQAADDRLVALQRRYDDETTHATVPAEQERWLAWIRTTLDTLPAGTVWTSRKYWKR